METAGKSSLPGESHSLEVNPITPHAALHTPLSPGLEQLMILARIWAWALIQVRLRGPAAVALCQLSFPLCWRNIPSPLFYFGAEMFMPFPHLLEDSVYLVKLLHNVFSFTKRGWEVKYSPRWIELHPSFSPTRQELCYHEGSTAWSRGHIYRNKISIGKKV